MEFCSNIVRSKSLDIKENRVYLQPSKLKFLPTEFNLKLVVELGGDSEIPPVGPVELS
jgi:hypothetical protein